MKTQHVRFQTVFERKLPLAHGTHVPPGATVSGNVVHVVRANRVALATSLTQVLGQFLVDMRHVTFQSSLACECTLTQRAHKPPGLLPSPTHLCACYGTVKCLRITDLGLFKHRTACYYRSELGTSSTVVSVSSGETPTRMTHVDLAKTQGVKLVGWKSHLNILRYVKSFQQCQYSFSFQKESVRQALNCAITRIKWQMCLRLHL